MNRMDRTLISANSTMGRRIGRSLLITLGSVFSLTASATNVAPPQALQAAGSTGNAAAPSTAGGTASPTPSEAKKPSEERPNENKPTATQRDRSATYTPTNSDQCQYSAQIDGKFGCTGTHSLVQNAMMMNMLTQAGGAAATQAMGQSGQMQAYQQGTQAAAMTAAANTQIQTGYTQLSLGSANAALGVYQMYKSMEHDKIAKKAGSELTQGSGVSVVKLDANGANGQNAYIKSNQDAGYMQASSAGSVSDKTLSAYQMNQSGVQVRAVSQVRSVTSALSDAQTLEKTKQERQLDMNAHEADVREGLRTIGAHVSSEQSAASSTAFQGGMMSLMTGSQQIMSGGYSVSAGNKLLAVANSLKQTPTSKPPIITPPTLTNNPLAGTGLTSRGPAAITGDGTAGSSASSDPNPSPSSATPDLGNPFGPNGLPSGIPDAPKAGDFTLGGPAPGGGGGGGDTGGGGGKGTAVAEKPNEDAQQAQLAPNQGGPNYESGGAASGARGGAKTPDGPDLSSLLAKFLPQKDEAPAHQNGILDYGTPTPEAPDGSILGRTGPTLFQRASSTYQEQFTRGRFGS